MTPPTIGGTGHQLDERRVGVGHDVHRLVAGGPLVIGGVPVSEEVRFATPSDGDVLCHALIDALAGALVDGDLGDHFPADDDPRARGARSLDYLSAMQVRVRERGFGVEQVDAFVTLGTVRLRPHLEGMRANLAQALGVGRDRVSVKARTNDGLGPEGEGTAASATAVVLLRSRPAAQHSGGAQLDRIRVPVVLLLRRLAHRLRHATGRAGTRGGQATNP